MIGEDAPAVEDRGSGPWKARGRPGGDPVEDCGGELWRGFFGAGVFTTQRKTDLAAGV